MNISVSFLQQIGHMLFFSKFSVAIASEFTIIPCHKQSRMIVVLCITGVSGINNQPTAIDDGNCLLNQSPLRVVRMNFEELRHSYIRKVGPR